MHVLLLQFRVPRALSLGGATANSTFFEAKPPSAKRRKPQLPLLPTNAHTTTTPGGDASHNDAGGVIDHSNQLASLKKPAEVPIVATTTTITPAPLPHTAKVVGQHPARRIFRIPADFGVLPSLSALGFATSLPPAVTVISTFILHDLGLFFSEQYTPLGIKLHMPVIPALFIFIFHQIENISVPPLHFIFLFHISAGGLPHMAAAASQNEEAVADLTSVGSENLYNTALALQEDITPNYLVFSMDPPAVKNSTSLDVASFLGLKKMKALQKYCSLRAAPGSIPIPAAVAANDKEDKEEKKVAPPLQKKKSTTAVTTPHSTSTTILSSSLYVPTPAAAAAATSRAAIFSYLNGCSGGGGGHHRHSQPPLVEDLEIPLSLLKSLMLCA